MDHHHERARYLQRNVAVLSPRSRDLLGLENVQVVVEASASGSRINHIVNETTLSSDQRIGELLGVLGGLLLDLLLVQTTEDNLDGTLRTHDRHLSRRPSIVEVTTEMLRRHDVISTTIRLTSDNGNLRRGGLTVSVEKLGTVTNDTVVLLVGSRQETRHVHEGNNRDIEGIQEANEAGSLDGRINIQTAGKMAGVVGDDTDGAAIHATESAQNVGSILRHDLEERVLVDDLLDQSLHVVRQVRVVRDDITQTLFLTVARIRGGLRLRLVAVVQWQVLIELTQLLQGNHIVVEGTMGHTRDGSVGLGTTKIFLADVLVGDGLHDVGTGDEHVRRALHHEDEVSHGRRVDGTTSARAHDHRDLRNNTGGIDVFQEDIGVTTEGVNTLLDSCSTRVVQANNRGSNTHGHVHNLADLLSVGLAERSTEDGEILTENEDLKYRAS